MSLSTIHRVMVYFILGIFFCLSFLLTHHWLGNPSLSMSLFALIMFGSGALSVISANPYFRKIYINCRSQGPVQTLSANVIACIQKEFESQEITLAGILHSPHTKAEIVSIGCFKRPVKSFILWNEDYYRNHTEEEQMAVGMHELGHAIERDHCTKLLGVFVLVALSIGLGLFIFLDTVILLDNLQKWLLVMNISRPKIFLIILYLDCILHFLKVNNFFFYRWVLQPREHKADEWAVKLMKTPQPILSWLQRAADQESTEKESDNSFLDFHPSAKKRIAHIERYWRNRENNETVK